MIIGDTKKQVVKNIQKAILDKEFNRKVEVGDPDISVEAQLKAVRKFYRIRENKAAFKVNSLPARTTQAVTLKQLGDAVKFADLEKLPDLKHGAIVTSNHFNPLDSLALREGLKKRYKKDTCAVAQATNLCQPGQLGYLFNHIDVLPLIKDAHYLKEDFEPRLKKRVEAGDLILVYPEEEMWFNYRKPRPVRRGAYQFAALSNAPVLSFLTEIRVRTGKNGEPLNDNDEFYQVNYIAHALGAIYPDKNLSVRENALKMMDEDYKLRCKAYEEIYGEKLDYKFTKADIVGWRG